MENDYLCCDKIRFAMQTDYITPKLISTLVRRFNLINQAQVIERIEKAVLTYYDISLEELHINPNVSYDAYVYIYMTPEVNGKWHIYGDEYIYNKPLYVGKGQGDRKDAHLQFTKNSEFDFALTSLARKNTEPIIKVYNYGCTHEMAYNLENYIIARLREQDVDLCNGTLQKESAKYVKELEISSFNLETILNSIIVDALNTTRSYRGAAKLLGISERSLYRKVKSLDIRKEDGIFNFSKKVNMS
jgi:Bacterial regulatory protein, Fis family